jgi:hypothetical protein
VISAEAHDWSSRGCRVHVERHYGHRYVHRDDCYYAKQLPRRYAISPAQNFDAWNYGSRGGIGQYRLPCDGRAAYWDGSQCVRWAISGNGAK